VSPFRYWALFGPDAPASRSLFAEVKQTSLSRWQSPHVSSQRDEGDVGSGRQWRVEREPVSGNGCKRRPTEATRFDSTEWAARVFGVRTKAAITAAKARGTKLGGNRGVKPTVKMRIQSAAGRQQRAASRAADNSDYLRLRRRSRAGSALSTATSESRGSSRTRGDARSRVCFPASASFAMFDVIFLPRAARGKARGR